MLRFQLARATRTFSTSVAARKTATDSVKDTLKKVDRTVSDAAVAGINKGAAAAESVKEATGMGASEAKAKGEELAGKAKGGAQELSGKAKGAAAEAEGKAKGAAEEIKGKM